MFTRCNVIWKRITQDRWVLQTISRYNILFSHRPWQSSLPHSHTSEEERLFIETEIQSFLQIGGTGGLGVPVERSQILAVVEAGMGILLS